VSEPIEQTRDIDTLIPHPRNYNQHPPAQIERLAASLRQFGQVRPIVVHGDTIVAGHGVYLAAKHLGYTSLRVTHLPDDWTEEQAMAYLVADNETRRGAEPDDAELAALLNELQQADFDIAAMGFDDTEYGALLDGLTPELPDPGNGGDGFEPDEAAPCRVQAGDVWLIGGVHRLICGDCTDPATVERLMQGETPLLMITDPPYGVNYDANWRVESNVGRDLPETLRQATAVGQVANDFVSDWQQVYALSNAVVAYVWCSSWYIGDVQNHLKNADYVRRALIIWIKPNFVLSRGHYHWQHEPCWYAVQANQSSHWSGDRTQSTVWEIPSLQPMGRSQDVQDQATGHSTQKPVECMARPMRNHGQSGDLVYDPFLGSGTTIIAAHRTGRRCYGCEISPEYCEIILQRCEAEGLSVERVSTAAVDEGADSL
jgi:DNA modification methylase